MSAHQFRFLTASQIIRLYETNIIRARPTQATYLESAVFSPQQHMHYGQNDLFQLASILAQKITLNHAYQDGNKRTALIAANMFLQLHGYQLRWHSLPATKSMTRLRTLMLLLQRDNGMLSSWQASIRV
ncbi:uncharacterized protein BKA55DRAFT_569597 [Fusarium redolens]|uniref:Fido domain-containing protein n=1 Tax=Fusarium redolens TaxID=48865 RepID=A0A9P9H0V3_FUSRE|nr:uncharacterized protein BKA55DRAFT_569597 [Fusarium redolens]KAH7248631.1 hypothetical protein BKA55DRAFT_569597 [Fusarium redolens]